MATSSQDGVSSVSLEIDLATRLISLINSLLIIVKLIVTMLFPIHFECSL